MTSAQTSVTYLLVFACGFLCAFTLVGLNQSTSAFLPILDSPTHAITTIPAVRRNDDVDIDQSRYRKALEESLGFFDDILDDKWLRRKKITLSHDHSEIVIPKGDDREQLWYYANWHPDFNCEFEDVIGFGDGAKWICDPHRLRKKNDCLVYSVGSNGHFEFEIELQKVLPNCEIHIFDINDFTRRMMNEGVNASFHAWGLGSSDGHRNIREKLGLPPLAFKSFRQTVHELGHVGRFIDILKIDCEGCEWISYLDWFKDPGILGMRQILLETHYAPRGAQSFFEYIREMGYVIFHKEPNIQFGGGSCVEFGFLQLNKTFFSNSH